MSPYKPMKLRAYRQWIAQYGWVLKKAGMDCKLYNEAGVLVIRNIILTHPGNEGVAADSVNKTQKALQELGLE